METVTAEFVSVSALRAEDVDAALKVSMAVDSVEPVKVRLVPIVELELILALKVAPTDNDEFVKTMAEPVLVK